MHIPHLLLEIVESLIRLGNEEACRSPMSASGPTEKCRRDTFMSAIDATAEKYCSA
jgi:hypothetical protein